MPRRPLLSRFRSQNPKRYYLRSKHLFAEVPVPRRPLLSRFRSQNPKRYYLRSKHLFAEVPVPRRPLLSRFRSQNPKRYYLRSKHLFAEVPVPRRPLLSRFRSQNPKRYYLRSKHLFAESAKLLSRFRSQNPKRYYLRSKCSPRSPCLDLSCFAHLSETVHYQQAPVRRGPRTSPFNLKTTYASTCSEVPVPRRPLLTVSLAELLLTHVRRGPRASATCHVSETPSSQMVFA